MAEQNKPSPTLDAELEAWLDTEDGAVREVIVEGRLPRRQVRFTPGTPQERQVKEVITEAGDSRTTVLRELQEFLTTLLGHPPGILQAAGAIPVRVTRDQLRQIIQHPLVGGVQSNREFMTKATQRNPIPVTD